MWHNMNIVAAAQAWKVLFIHVGNEPGFVKGQSDLLFAIKMMTTTFFFVDYYDEMHGENYFLVQLLSNISTNSVIV